MCGTDQKVTKMMKDAEKRKAAFEAQQEKECKRKKMELEQQEVANAEFFSESGSESDDGQNNDPA